MVAWTNVGDLWICPIGPRNAQDRISPTRRQAGHVLLQAPWRRSGAALGFRRTEILRQSEGLRRCRHHRVSAVRLEQPASGEGPRGRLSAQVLLDRTVAVYGLSCS